MHLSASECQQLTDTVNYLFANVSRESIVHQFRIEYVRLPSNREILERSVHYEDAVAKAQSINQYFQVTGSQQAISPEQVLEMWEREKKGIEFTPENIERICRISLDNIHFQLQTTSDWAIAWLFTTRITASHLPSDLPLLLSQMVLDAYRQVDRCQSAANKPMPHFVWRSKFSKQKAARRLFGLSENATLDEVRSAYRTLCKQHHPDNGGSQEEFIRVRESYDILAASAI